jgi:hypothetical protein
MAVQGGKKNTIIVECMQDSRLGWWELSVGSNQKEPSNFSNKYILHQTFY